MMQIGHGWRTRRHVRRRWAPWLGLVAPALLALGCRSPYLASPPARSPLADAASETGAFPTGRDPAEPYSPRSTPSAASASSSTEVRPVSDLQAEEIPPPATRSATPPAAPKSLDPGPAARLVEGRPVRALDPSARDADFAPLSLREVSESVFVAFPALEALRQELTIAEGKEISAWGEFDLKIKADSIAAPMGYYKNYRSAVRFEQGVFGSGANLFGNYQIGTGNIPPWYGERETDDGGQFRAGLLLPLLRDRSIDQRRADIFQATLRRQQVDPVVRSALLEFNLTAADAYWSWVGAGLNYDVQYEMMRLTIVRNRVYEERVKQKDLAPIELVQNRRLIAAREAKVIEAERKLQQSAIKLSLFLRDEAGMPIAPSPALLPAKFPEPDEPDPTVVDQDIAVALDNRPELVDLELQRELAEVDLDAGRNLRLPALNAVVDAAKDVGAPASKKGDKTPFELEAGVLIDVPLQRRKADGKIREARGKLAQIAAKREFVENKIEVQVRDAMSALATSYQRLRRARENLALAKQLEQAERDRFDAGESDMLRVALQETAAIEAAVTEIETLADYFRAQAAMQAAMGADPLSD